MKQKCLPADIRTAFVGYVDRLAYRGRLARPDPRVILALAGMLLGLLMGLAMLLVLYV